MEHFIHRIREEYGNCTYTIPSLVEGVIESSGSNLDSSLFFFGKYLTYIQINNNRTMHNPPIDIPAVPKLLAK